MDKNSLLKDLVEELSKNPSLVDELKRDPEKVIGQILLRQPVYQGDKWVYRIVVMVLGFTVVTTVVGGLVLKGMASAELPPALIALGSGALGALAGLLAPSPRQ